MAFLETLKLAFDHNLIIGNLPGKLSLDKIAEKMEKDKEEQALETFGLFDSNQANYNTYYPDVTSEDLQPKDNEFIEPVFRALSEVVVHKEWNPVDFGENGVLKKSMSLLKGSTVNADHETAIGNAMGAVKQVSWQDSYKTEKGIMVPAGINAVLKIDGKSHPRVARAIMMDPPAIHSTSVTLRFLWEKSHPELSDDEFFNKSGSFDKDKKLIRRIATQIKNYNEISLVSHGADPYAQLVKDAEIVNPKWGDISYNSVTGSQKKKQYYFLYDYKTDVIQNSIPKETINNNSNLQTDKMNKEFLIALAAVLGIKLVNEAEPGDADIKLVQDAVAAAVNAKTASDQSLVAVQAEVDRLKPIETTYNNEKAAMAESVELKSFKDTETKTLRDKVASTYKTLSGGTVPDTDAIANLIKTASYETLSALNIQYSKQLEEKFPLTCKSCGGKEVNRASSIQSEGDEGEKNIPSSDIKSKLTSKARSRNKVVGMEEEE